MLQAVIDESSLPVLVSRWFEARSIPTLDLTQTRALLERQPRSLLGPRLPPRAP